MRKTCDRCKEKTNYTLLSTFNREQVCSECKEDESRAPGYDHAIATKLEHLRNGNYSFTGVGLADPDEEFLQQCREERKIQTGADDGLSNRI